MREYYLYENWHRDRARVHRDGCGHVNRERITDGRDWQRDRWIALGAFETPAEAFIEARVLIRNAYDDFNYCKGCLYGHVIPLRAPPA